MACSLTSPFLVAVLSVSLFLVGSAASGAESAALDAPTTPLLDDFNRPDENPLSGGGNWAKADTSSTDIRLGNNVIGLAGGGVALFYWTPTAFDGDVEVWATYRGAGMDDGAAADLGIVTDVGGTNQMDGYVLRAVNTFGFAGWQVRKRANWGGAQVLAQVPFGARGIPSSGQRILLRRVGSQLEGWRSIDGGATWVREIVADDPQYTTNLRIAAGFSIALASSPSWDDFGGGAIGTPPPPAGPPPGQSIGTTCERGSLALTASCTFADPVNSRTSAFVNHVEDLATPGTGVSFAWTRTYTSTDETAGSLGAGWTHTYAAALRIQPNGDVLARGEEGQEVVFARQADGSFDGAPGARAALTAVAGGYELVRADQVLYRFDAGGRLLRVEDRNAQGVSLAYDGQGRLTTITDAAGRQANVAYTAAGLVSEVRAADGRTATYGYGSGRLTSVTDARGNNWTYGYDGDGRLTTIRDPLGHVQVANVYGADGRVERQADALGTVTTFSWDDGTGVATATDANGNVWRHDYDEGLLAREVDPLGNVTEVGRDEDLNETAVTGPTGERTTMAYDAAGNVLTATAPGSLGSVRKTFAYNARNDPKLVTDARGVRTEYAYDARGNVASVSQQGARVAAYDHDGAGRVVSATDGNGETTTYAYDARGNLVSQTDAAGNETRYTYDDAGRVLTRVDPEGNCPGCAPADFTWSYTYDAAGNRLTERDPLGHVTTQAYDEAERLVAVTDANGHRTSYAYDDANRLVRETAPDPDGAGRQAAPVTSYAYDAVGNRTVETDARGNATTFGYDAANRLIAKTSPDPDGTGPATAPQTTYGYDANGNVISVVEPRGNVPGSDPDAFRTIHTYDAAGRLLATRDPLGYVRTTVYDAVGNVALERDANDHATSYEYDAAGRVLSVTAADGGATRYGYDGAGNLLTRTDANGHTTRFAYDGEGRLVSETGPDPDGAGPGAPAVTSFTYDANGNRLTITDANGNATATAGDGRTTFGYDRANRLVSIDYSDDTPDVAFAYDPVGNRVRMTDGAGMETRTYDAFDRLLSVSRGANTFTYAYDAASNVVRRAYPGSVVADYAYDADNRLVSVTNGGQQTTYAYDAASNLVQTMLPAGNGHVETRTYDRAGRLTEVATQRGSVVVARFTATLDPVGNPTAVVRTGSLPLTQTYAYDAADRILSLCFQVGDCPGANDPFVRWTYDRVGNRLTERRPRGTRAYAYDGRDRLLSAGATSFSYDENGNQLSAGARRFSYDLANRLETTVLGNTTTSYQYDGDGMRLQASTGEQANRKTNFLWDVAYGIPQLARETNGAGSLLRRYLYGVRRISQAAGNQTSYFVYDALGSVANATSASGSLQWSVAYEPFGASRAEQRAQGSQPDVFMRFAGEYLDPTGLYHLRARHYDPATGRFLRPDPADTAVGSPLVASYVYVANRPTVMVDPSGETFTPVFSGRGLASFAGSLVDWESPAIRCQAQLCGRALRPPVSRVYPVPRRFASRVVRLPKPFGVHPTSGLPGYPAIDFAADAPAPVVAVESGRVRHFSGHDPRSGPVGGVHGPFGLSLYLRGDTGTDYFYTHLAARNVSVGSRVRVGQIIGRIGDYSRWGGLDHVHLGANVGRTARNYGRAYDQGVAIIISISRAPRP